MELKWSFSNMERVAVKHILRYDNATSSYDLFFACQNTTMLHGFCDANWGGSIDNRKLTTGFANFSWVSLDLMDFVMTRNSTKDRDCT